MSNTDTVEVPGHATELQDAEHRVALATPATAVYAVLADVSHWPQVFPPTVHAERLVGDDRTERIRVVATAGEDVKSWESERTLDAVAGTITFRQTRFLHPVAFMEGRWQVQQDGPDACTVVLGHRYAATDPSHRGWLREVIDRNSRAELAALRSALEVRPGDPMSPDPRLVDFSDSVKVSAPPDEVFAFVDQADRWAERLPHVAEVKFRRLPDGVQDLAMTTRTPDAGTHLTRSYRVVLPGGAIVYKQFTLPSLMATHTGRWTFQAVEGGTLATSAHTVLIETDRIVETLGPGADLATAREKIQAALSANSIATLRLAKVHAEAAHAQGQRP